MTKCEGCQGTLLPETGPYCAFCVEILNEAYRRGTTGDYDRPSRYREERPEDVEERARNKERKFKGMLCTKCATFIEEQWPGARIPTFLCRTCNIAWEYSNLQGHWTANQLDKNEIQHMDLTLKALKGESTLLGDLLDGKI